MLYCMHYHYNAIAIMLSAKTKKEIKTCYQNLKDSMDTFIPRRGQNFLIAEIAKTLGGEYDKERRILVAEAGTGIGKSLAYLIGAIPYAQANNKKIVISTATVALQEQLLAKDLPLFYRIYQKPLKFMLAKGRQRYCCAERLADACSDAPSQLSLFNEKPHASDKTLLDNLYKALSSGKWDGDRDNWPQMIPDRVWRTIASDKHTCKMSFPAHRNCPFQVSRGDLREADVIIANHSLLLADLELGGGVILPDPEDTIYLIDEAHHLSRIARDFSAVSASVKGVLSWIEVVKQSATKLGRLAQTGRAFIFVETVSENIDFLINDFKELLHTFNSLSFNDDKVLRFENGKLPDWLQKKATTYREVTKKLSVAYQKLFELVEDRILENPSLTNKTAPVMAEAGFFLPRIEKLEKAWALMATENKPKGAPLARWIEKTTFGESDDYQINTSPIEIGFRLDQLLWSRAFASVLVSATLKALNSFDYFCREIGLSTHDNTQFLTITSPFDYAQQAKLIIPPISLEPSAKAFTEELIKLIPTYLEDQSSSLVLFSSYWQMNRVAENLSALFKEKGWHLLLQRQKPRQELLKEHADNCEKGQPSVLFGTGSFSEGLDLPGKLLENVIITKIPFAVPTSPIEAAHAEYIESKGGNPFMQISVPNASKKLIQSVGRLLRKETDVGRIVILDKRLITKRYGKALLDALPPFTQEIHRI